MFRHFNVMGALIAYTGLFLISFWLRGRPGQASRKLRYFLLALAALLAVVQIVWLQRQPRHMPWAEFLFLAAVVTALGISGWYYRRKRERIP